MRQPLKNKVFISTRPSGRSDELTRLFGEKGAEVLEMPLIEIKASILTDKEKKQLQNLEKFQWLVFTSPNGVRYFFNALENITRKNKIPASLQIGVIGSKTEKVVEQFGYKAAFVNPGNTGEEFAEAFHAKLSTQPHPRVLLALGNLARDVIQDKLRERASCVRIDVYETIAPETADENIVQRIRDDRYEMIIFTSPSGIQNFMKPARGIHPENLRIACIGEVTAGAAKEAGINPMVVAKDASAKGIVESITNYYK